MFKKERLKSLLVFFIFFSFLIFSQNFQIDNLRAATPATVLTYQGRLFSADDVPVSDSSISMLFEIYDAESGGNCVWSNSSSTCASSTARTVALRDNGRFTEVLGDTGATPAYEAINSSIFEDNASLYLEVTVAGEALSPRKRITSSPYAINTATLEGLSADEFVQVVGGCDNCLDWSSLAQEMMLDGAPGQVDFDGPGPGSPLDVGFTAVQGESEFLVYDFANANELSSNVSGFMVNLDPEGIPDASFSSFSVTSGNKISDYDGLGVTGNLANSLFLIQKTSGILMLANPESNSILTVGGDAGSLAGVPGTGLSEQTGISIDSDDLTTGEGLSVGQTNSNAIDFSGNFISISQSLSNGSSTSTGEFLQIVSNNAGSATDSSKLIDLLQQNSASTGDIIDISQSGQGSALRASTSNGSSSQPLLDLIATSETFAGEGIKLTYSGSSSAIYIDGVRDTAGTTSAFRVNDEIDGYLVSLDNVDDGTPSDSYQGISLTACADSATFDCDFITFFDGGGDELGGISAGGYAGSTGISFNTSNKGIAHFFSGTLSNFDDGDVVTWDGSSLSVVNDIDDIPAGVYSENVALTTNWNSSSIDSDSIVPIVTYGVVDARVTDGAGGVSVGSYLTINTDGSLELAGANDPIYAYALELHPGGGTALIEVFYLPFGSLDRTLYDGELEFVSDGGGYVTVLSDANPGTSVSNKDIVTFNGTDIVQASDDAPFLGVVTDDPGFIANYSGQSNLVPVVVSGRATIDVVKANGQDISAGDYIGINNVDGFGQKLYGAGYVIGVALESQNFGGGGDGSTAELDIFVQPQYSSADYFNQSSDSFDSPYALTIPYEDADTIGETTRSSIRFGSSTMDDDGDLITAETGLLTYRVDARGREFFGFGQGASDTGPVRTMAEFFIDEGVYGFARADYLQADIGLRIGENINNLNELVFYGNPGGDPSNAVFGPTLINVIGVPSVPPGTSINVSTNEDLEVGTILCVLGNDGQCDYDSDEVMRVSAVNSNGSGITVVRDINSVGSATLGDKDILGFYPDEISDAGLTGLTVSGSFGPAVTTITLDSTALLAEGMLLCNRDEESLDCDIGIDELILVEDIQNSTTIVVTRGFMGSQATTLDDDDDLIVVGEQNEGNATFEFSKQVTFNSALTPRVMNFGGVTSSSAYDSDDVSIVLSDDEIVADSVLCVVDSDGDCGERIQVTDASSAPTYTVTRGFDSTTASAITSGQALRVIGYPAGATRIYVGASPVVDEDILCAVGSNGVCDASDELIQVDSVDFSNGSLVVTRGFDSTTPATIVAGTNLVYVPRVDDALSGYRELDLTLIDASAEGPPTQFSSSDTTLLIDSNVNITQGLIVCVDEDADGFCDINDEQLRVLTVSDGATASDPDQITVQRGYNNTIPQIIPDDSRLLTFGSVSAQGIYNPDGFTEDLILRGVQGGDVFRISHNTRAERGESEFALSSIFYPGRLLSSGSAFQKQIGLFTDDLGGISVLRTTDHFGAFSPGGIFYPALRTGNSGEYRYEGQATAGIAFDGTNIITNATGFTGGAGLDFAETFPSDEELKPGEIVQFGTKPEHVERSKMQPYSKRLSGIVSTAPGFLAGGNYEEDFPIALVGRVPTNVTTENGAISIGDPITASATKEGFGMKATQDGYIVGYALEALAEGEEGQVVVFVRPGFYSESESLTRLEATGQLNVALQSLVNVASISGLGDRWSIRENGDFVTTGKITRLLKGVNMVDYTSYAVVSPAELVQVVGSAKLTDGRSHVKFKDTYPELSMLLRAGGDYHVFLTSNDSSQVFVSRKDETGFIIRDQDANSFATVDWLLVGKLHSYIDDEPEVEASDEDNSNQEDTVLELDDDADTDTTVDGSADDTVVDESENDAQMDSEDQDSTSEEGADTLGDQSDDLSDGDLVDEEALQDDQDQSLDQGASAESDSEDFGDEDDSGAEDAVPEESPQIPDESEG